MSDILERLRLRQRRIVDGTMHTCGDTCTHPDCLAVASLREIERLRAVNAAMRHDLGVLRGFHHEGCVAEIERLRGLLLRVNDADRHLEDGAYWVRLYYGDFEDIRAALADQPAAALGCVEIDWHRAAMAAGERIGGTGPDGYYAMTPQQWLDWFSTAYNSPESLK